MSKKKRIFLLSRAVVVEPKGLEGRYSPDLQLNVLSKDGVTPLISAGGSAPTHSKTEAYPGDDDPDPGQDKCY